MLVRAALCLVAIGCAHSVAPIANRAYDDDDDWRVRVPELCHAIPAAIDRVHGPALHGVRYAGPGHESETMNGTEHFAWRTSSPVSIHAVGVETLGGVPFAAWVETSDTAAKVCGALRLGVGGPDGLDDPGCMRRRRNRVITVGERAGAVRVTCLRR